MLPLGGCKLVKLVKCCQKHNFFLRFLSTQLSKRNFRIQCNVPGILFKSGFRIYWGGISFLNCKSQTSIIKISGNLLFQIRTTKNNSTNHIFCTALKLVQVEREQFCDNYSGHRATKFCISAKLYKLEIRKVDLAITKVTAGGCLGVVTNTTNLPRDVRRDFFWLKVGQIQL